MALTLSQTDIKLQVLINIHASRFFTGPLAIHAGKLAQTFATQLSEISRKEIERAENITL